MSDYSKITNFLSKDSLSLNDPAKYVKGSEIDAEYNAIAASIATKADTASPTLVTPNIGAATGTSLALGGGTALTTTNRTGTGNLVLATAPTLTGLTVSGGNFVSRGISDTATAVALTLSGSGANSVTIANSATNPEIGTSGGATVPLTFNTTGGAYHSFKTNSFEQARIAHTPSADRYITLTGSIGGNPAIGTSAGSLAISAALVLSQTTLLSTSVSLTNGAAASVGTLTNAPAAGNPTKWIPISDNGTTRYIPTW